MPKEGFQRLGAAIASSGEEYKQRLLNPDSREATVLQGWGGVPFDLTKAEVKKIVAINETQLSKFAEKLAELQQQAPSRFRPQ